VQPGASAPLRLLPAATTARAAMASQSAHTSFIVGQLRFRHLSPAEQQERRRLELCFNCDEPYVCGHMCQRLFYLEAIDYLDDDIPVEVAVAAMGVDPPEQFAASAEPAATYSLIVEGGVLPTSPSMPSSGSRLRTSCFFWRQYMDTISSHSSTLAPRRTLSMQTSCVAYTSP
jgi:hypothetical protein